LRLTVSSSTPRVCFQILPLCLSAMRGPFSFFGASLLRFFFFSFVTGGVSFPPPGLSMFFFPFVRGKFFPVSLALHPPDTLVLHIWLPTLG